ncbi:MAG: hypothetical protein NWS40_03140 [Crocinitomicaceae bacterium]|nr:hypothetical protein [Crocinitomicaceae bacterium]
MNFNKKLIVIAFVGTILAIFWQELNTYYLQNTDSNRFGMIQTADEASYLVPPINYLSEGIWADNSDGITRFYQRPPGYGSIYMICTLILGKYALLGIKTIQILGYFFSILLIGKISILLLPKQKTALTAALITALLPMYSGFMYYTLTEGITPVLTLWTIYSYLNFNPSKKPFAVIIATSLLILVRPQMILLPFLFIAYHLLKREKKLALVISIGFIPFALWQLRTFSISNEIPGLHSIYSSKNNTLFRPTHEAMTNLFRIWESDGEQFHAAIAAIKNNRLDEALLEVPIEFHAEVKPILVEYERVLNSKNDFKSRKYLAAEKKLIRHTNAVINSLKKENKFLTHIKTPLESARYLLSKSQMNLYIFQDPLRGNPFIELLRILSVLLINLGFLAAFMLFFRFKLDVLTVLSAFMCITFFYLIYVQRLNEERYLTPFLPLLLICLLHGFDTLKNTVQTQFFIK